MDDSCHPPRLQPSPFHIFDVFGVPFLTALIFFRFRTHGGESEQFLLNQFVNVLIERWSFESSEDKMCQMEDLILKSCMQW